MPTELTIAIPAYDNADYLRRALDSILQQTLRPLQIVVFDDASPTSLEPVVKSFRERCPEDVSVEYVRFASNQKIDAFYEIYRYVRTPWMLQMHHDDELVDPRFLETWCNLKDSHPNLNIVYGNTIVEGSCEPMFPVEDPAWSIIDGQSFIARVLGGSVTAWSAVVYRLDPLRQHGWPRPPLFLDNAIYESTGLDRDEGFNTLYLLASEGDVAMSSQVVAQRGMPSTAYSRSKLWSTPGNSLYVIYSAAERYLGDLGHVEESRLVGFARLWYGLPVDEGWRMRQVQSALGDIKLSKSHYIKVKFLTYVGLNGFMLARSLSKAGHQNHANESILQVNWGHVFRTTKGSLKWSLKNVLGRN